MSIESKLDALSLETAEKSKKRLGLVPLAPKKAPNTAGQQVRVETNMRRLVVAPNQPIYKYAVVVKYVYLNKDKKEVAVEMSKSTKKGAENINDKRRCKKIYKLAIEKFSQLRKGGPYFYDQQASLFSLSLIPNEDQIKFEVDDVSPRSNFVRAEFAIQKCADSFQTTSNDITKTVNSCPANADRTFLEAMSIITSGPAYDNPNVITVGSCVHYLYDHSGTDIQTVNYDAGMKYSAVGTFKSVTTLQGDQKGDKKVPPTLYMTAEMKTTLFHPDNACLVDVLSTYPQFKPDLAANSPAGKTLLRAVLGIEVYCAYGPAQEFEDDAPIVRIRGFGNSALQQTFLLNGVETSVAAYFQAKYGINLRFPKLLTIQGKMRDGGKAYFPAELLKLCPSQSVTNDQMIGNEQRDMIRISAAPPHVRKNNTNAVVREVGLASETIQNFISVKAPERVLGIVAPKPDILFANNSKVNWSANQRVPTDFKPAGKYVNAMSLTNWEVVFVQNEAMEDVIPLLMFAMRENGMTVNKPDVTFIVRHDLEAVFQKAKAANRQLLFFITRSKYNFHQEMKALEQEYDILTQEVRYETAEKVFRSPDTKKNIVHKTNMKLGGLNYIVAHPEIKDPARLIIGFETSQRGGGGDGPIAIGYAANMMKHPQQYAGGFVFVPRARDIYGPIIKSTVQKIIDTAARIRCPPKEIFVYINGVTEGQYALINEVYAEEVKNACREFKNFKPHINIIATSKTHNTRLYAMNDRGVSNLEPGTIVDHTIVSPVLSEWWQTSAVARQGTTKAVKFTLIFSTNSALTMRNYEELSYALCYDHQIVCQPVSLPAPLFIAGRYSQRGAMLLAHRGAQYKNGEVDYEATNALLGYCNKMLNATRFNA